MPVGLEVGGLFVVMLEGKQSSLGGARRRTWFDGGLATAAGNRSWCVSAYPGAFDFNIALYFTRSYDCIKQ